MRSPRRRMWEDGLEADSSPMPVCVCLSSQRGFGKFFLMGKVAQGGRAAR